MIKKKLLKTKKKEQLPSRITNDTVAQHREKVLAGGRKHKYPLQYTKHKLVWNTIIISIISLILLTVLVWAQLYVFKDTGDVAYRITRVFPLPIATIDGKNVRYSDYLLYQRSTVAVQNGRGSEEAADKASFQRQEALNRAIEKAYVEKIAAERGILIGDDQVEAAIKSQRESSELSESSYESALLERLGWSMDEMRQALRATLLKQAVAFSVDDNASQISKQVNNSLRSGRSLQDVAGQFSKEVELVSNVTVPKNNVDGGLSEAAGKLKPGDISAATKTLSGDGYYFIELHKDAGKNLNYSYIKVPLKVLQGDIAKLLKSDEVKKYVDVK